MFCTKCGKEIMDEAVICPGCGCATNNFRANSVSPETEYSLISQLAEKVKINAVIWLIIGIIQLFLGWYFNYFLLIVAILNIVSSIIDFNYCSKVINNPCGIVDRFTQLTGPIITLIYNLIFGGVIGVVGSIYYFVGIRSFVLTHRNEFAQIERSYSSNTTV